MAVNSKQSVTTKHDDYHKYAPDWKRCRDAAAGQRAVQKAGTDYLPRLTEQSEAEYQAYKSRAVFFNATWRTVVGLEGMIFRKPYVIDIPASIKSMLDNVDMSGTPLEIFALEVTEELLITGRQGLLVDCPRVIAGATAADAQRANVRPYLVAYPPESILNWRCGVVNNAKVLTFIVLEETDESVGDDEFTTKTEKQWRVLDLVAGVYRQRIFKLDAKGEQYVVPGSEVYPLQNGVTMPFIPFYFIGVDDASEEVDDPPLIDLVNMNLSHYRTTADYEHGCHFTGLPQPWISGYTKIDNEKLTIGSTSAWIFPDTQAKAGYLALDSGFKALETNLANKEKAMAVLGARMLEHQRIQAEAADTARIHRSGESSMLATMARAISQGMKLALQQLSDWAGGKTPIVFELNRDFVPAHMQPQEITAIVAAWQLGAISKESLFLNLQKGELIADDVTFEEEEQRIDEDQNTAAARAVKDAVNQAQALADLQQANDGADAQGSIG